MAYFEAADQAAELRDLVTRIGSAEDKLAALRLTAVHLAQKHEVQRSSGAPDTTAWLAGATASGSKQAADDVFLAEAVETSAKATDTAMTGGKLPANKALIITRTLDRLHDGVSREDRAHVEKALVEQAVSLDPNRLRKAARRALAAVEPDPVVVDAHEDRQVADEESRALRRRVPAPRPHSRGQTARRADLVAHVSQGRPKRVGVLSRR